MDNLRVLQFQVNDIAFPRATVSMYATCMKKNNFTKLQQCDASRSDEMLLDSLYNTQYLIRGVPETVDCAVAHKLGVRSIMNNVRITVDNIVYNKRRETASDSEKRHWRLQCRRDTITKECCKARCIYYAQVNCFEMLK